MKSRKIFKGFNHLFQYVYDLAKLNILFILYTFRGFIFLGIFPAFVSLLNCTRLIFYNKKEDSFRQLFKDTYKRDFKQSNLTGWSFTILGLIIYANYVAIQSASYEIPFFVIFSFYTLIFMYITVGLWVFPLMSFHYNTIKKHVMNAFILGISNILKTLFLMLSIFLIFYTSLAVPAFLLFFTASLLSLIGLRITRDPIREIRVEI